MRRSRWRRDWVSEGLEARGEGRGTSKFGSHAHRFDRAGGFGAALPSQIECRAMGDASAHDGQAERNVHGTVHSQKLERDVPLIVIHGDDGIELAIAGAEQERVGRVGALDLQSSAAPRLRRGR